MLVRPVPLQEKNSFMKKCITSLLLLFSLSLTGQTQDSWPIFRGDAALSGFTKSEFPETLDILWTFKGGDQFKGSPVIYNGVIVVASMDGLLYGLNLAGKELWVYTCESGFEASATISHNKVYIGDMAGQMHCLNLETGTLLWSFKTDGQIMGSANIYNLEGKEIILFGSYDYFLYALDANLGEVLWKYESDNFINGAPACFDGNVVFGGCDGFIHVVDIESGELIKKVEVATYVAGSPAMKDSLVFVGDYDGRFSCVDIKNSNIVWTWEDETKNLPFISSPSIVNGIVMAGCRDKFIYCYNMEDGSLYWRYNTGSRVDASVIVNHSKVIVANMRGDVIILDSSTGSLLNQIELGVAISGTPAIINKTIIIAAEDGYVYCLGEK